MAFYVKKTAKPGEPVFAGQAPAPQAPGATRSPQIPGQVPDRSSVPEHGELPVPAPIGEVRRPLVEYGTSQRIMGVFENVDGDPTDPARFEQATVSYEEIRKAVPSLRTPVRPTAGYALADGTRVSNAELEALSAGADTDFVDG
jgi:hypothetical protein